MSGADGAPDSDVSACRMEEMLRQKVQQQAQEISQYQSHVVWASGYARLCEERTRAVDPLADINVSKGKVGHYNQSQSAQINATKRPFYTAVAGVGAAYALVQSK